ncbi:MAG: Gx transporter family protein [Oscillospiraceae bacterium]|nr:Gx transporter family protein [Oscillospiraceae bacterium]
MNPYKSRAYYASVMGVMLALAVALTTIESLISLFLPMSGFGVRIGLSNVVIMTAALMMNMPSAFILTVMKSLFVALTRGLTAGLLSLSGGIPAFLIMALLFKRTRSSYILISIISAIAHMTGQLIASSILLKSIFSIYYAPMLIATSILSGVCTGVILNAELKMEWRLFVHNENAEGRPNPPQ